MTTKRLHLFSYAHESALREVVVTGDPLRWLTRHSEEVKDYCLARVFFESGSTGLIPYSFTAIKHPGNKAWEVVDPAWISMLPP